METKTKMMIAGGVLALVVTIIVIVVVVNNKEDEKPKDKAKPKSEKPKGETPPPPIKCQSDSTCGKGVCAQYKNNEYKSCKNSSHLGTLSDWCTTLRNGDDCHKNGQCLSGYCDAGKCI